MLRYEFIKEAVEEYVENILQLLNIKHIHNIMVEIGKHNAEEVELGENTLV